MEAKPKFQPGDVVIRKEDLERSTRECYIYKIDNISFINGKFYFTYGQCEQKFYFTYGQCEQNYSEGLSGILPEDGFIKLNDYESFKEEYEKIITDQIHEFIQYRLKQRDLVLEQVKRFDVDEYGSGGDKFCYIIPKERIPYFLSRL